MFTEIIMIMIIIIMKRELPVSIISEEIHSKCIMGLETLANGPQYLYIISISINMCMLGVPKAFFWRRVQSKTVTQLDTRGC